RVGLLTRCQVFIWGRKDSRIDPRGASRGAIVFELAEAAEVTASGRLVAVDLLQYFEHIRLAWDTRRLLGLVIPEQIVKTLIAWQGAGGIALFEALAQLVGEPGVRTAVTRGISRLVMPLQHPLRIGKTAFEFGDLGRREEEHFGLNIRRVELAALHLRGFVP